MICWFRRKYVLVNNNFQLFLIITLAYELRPLAKIMTQPWIMVNNYMKFEGSHTHTLCFGEDWRADRQAWCTSCYRGIIGFCSSGSEYRTIVLKMTNIILLYTDEYMYDDELGKSNPQYKRTCPSIDRTRSINVTALNPQNSPNKHQLGRINILSSVTDAEAGAWE